MLDQKVFELKEAFERIEMTKSYEVTFSSLWYGAMPCTGVEGVVLL